MFKKDKTYLEKQGLIKKCDEKLENGLINEVLYNECLKRIEDCDIANNCTLNMYIDQEQLKDDLLERVLEISDTENRKKIETKIKDGLISNLEEYKMSLLEFDEPIGKLISCYFDNKVLIKVKAFEDEFDGINYELKINKKSILVLNFNCKFLVKGCSIERGALIIEAEQAEASKHNILNCENILKVLKKDMYLINDDYLYKQAYNLLNPCCNVIEG